MWGCQHAPRTLITAGDASPRACTSMLLRPDRSFSSLISSISFKSLRTSSADSMSSAALGSHAMGVRACVQRGEGRSGGLRAHVLVQQQMADFQPVEW